MRRFEMGKNNFLVSDEWGEMITSLPKDKAGELFQGLFLLRKDPDYKIEDPVLAAIFNMMKKYMAEKEEKYQQRCEKNAENGAKSHDKKKKKTKDSDCKQSVANATDSNPNSAEVSISISNIINYLNSKTGRNYSPNTAETRKLVTARLREGYTEEDFFWLIDTKVDEWKDDAKMEKFLRPNTLFAQSHFDDYLNQRPRVSPKIEESKTPTNRIKYDCDDYDTMIKFRDLGYMIDDDGYWIDKKGNWITEDTA